MRRDEDTFSRKRPVSLTLELEDEDERPPPGVLSLERMQPILTATEARCDLLRFRRLLLGLIDEAEAWASIDYCLANRILPYWHELGLPAKTVHFYGAAVARGYRRSWARAQRGQGAERLQ